MKVDEVLKGYGEGWIPTNKARQQLKELVLGCLPPEKKEFQKSAIPNDILAHYEDGFNSCRSIIEQSIEELFK